MKRLFPIIPLLLTLAFSGQAETLDASDARKRTAQWQRLIVENQGRSDWFKLQAVNGFFNQLRFAADAEIWQRENYWATPSEFLTRGAGDCEDFAIAKYMTLVTLGVEPDKLRLMYVKALRLNQPHMVLTYAGKPGQVPWVLDNLSGQIRLATERTDLQPVYSFNADGLWLAKARGNDRRLRDSRGLALWEELLARMTDGR